LEPPLNPFIQRDAAILMRRRIKHAIDICKGCGDTDNNIIAAMTQNGPGFTGMDGVYKFSNSLSPDKRSSGLN